MCGIDKSPAVAPNHPSSITANTNHQTKATYTNDSMTMRLDLQKRKQTSTHDRYSTGCSPIIGVERSPMASTRRATATRNHRANNITSSSTDVSNKMTLRLDLQSQNQTTTHDRYSAPCSPSNNRSARRRVVSSSYTEVGQMREVDLLCRSDSTTDRYATNFSMSSSREMRDDAAIENCLVGTSGSESTDASSERSRSSSRKRPLPRSSRSQMIEENEEDCIYDQPLLNSSTIQTPDESTTASTQTPDDTTSRGAEDSYTLNSYSSEFFPEERGERRWDRYAIVERPHHHHGCAPCTSQHHQLLCGGTESPASDVCCTTCARAKPSLSARARLENPSYHRAIVPVHPSSRALITYHFSQDTSSRRSSCRRSSYRSQSDEAEWDTDIVPIGGPETARPEDLIHGKSRNIFIGMLVEYIAESTSMLDQDIAPPLHVNLVQNVVQSAATAVLRQSLHVNISVASRSKRLHRALGSRKQRGSDYDVLSTIVASTDATVTSEDIPSPTQQGSKHAEATPFSMNSKLRKARLSRALRPRGKRDEESWRSLAEEKTLIIFRALVVALMQTYDLTCADLFSVTFVQFLFRFSSRYQRHLPCDYPPLVRYIGPSREYYERVAFFYVLQLIRLAIEKKQSLSKAADYFAALRGETSKPAKATKETSPAEFFEALLGRGQRQAEPETTPAGFFETLLGDQQQAEKDTTPADFFETLLRGQVSEEECETPKGSPSLEEQASDENEDSVYERLFAFDSSYRSLDSNSDDEDMSLDQDIMELLDQAAQETDLTKLPYFQVDCNAEDDESDDGLAEEITMTHHVPDLEFLNPDEDVNFSDQIVNEYIWEIIVETDLSALDYVNAHQQSSLPEHDDDFLTEEMQNLNSVEESLSCELSKITLDMVPKTSPIEQKTATSTALSRVEETRIWLEKLKSSTPVVASVSQTRTNKSQMEKAQEFSGVDRSRLKLYEQKMGTTERQARIEKLKARINNYKQGTLAAAPRREVPNKDVKLETTKQQEVAQLEPSSASLRERATTAAGEQTQVKRSGASMVEQPRKEFYPERTLSQEVVQPEIPRTAHVAEEITASQLANKAQTIETEEMPECQAAGIDDDLQDSNANVLQQGRTQQQELKKLEPLSEQRREQSSTRISEQKQLSQSKVYTRGEDPSKEVKQERMTPQTVVQLERPRNVLVVAEKTEPQDGETGKSETSEPEVASESQDSSIDELQEIAAHDFQHERTQQQEVFKLEPSSEQIAEQKQVARSEASGGEEPNKEVKQERTPLQAVVQTETPRTVLVVEERAESQSYESDKSETTEEPESASESQDSSIDELQEIATLEVQKSIEFQDEERKSKDEGKILPDDVNFWNEEEALRAVFAAIVAMSSDDDEREGSNYTESTGSTFNTEDARRAVQTALLEFPPFTAPSVPDTMPEGNAFCSNRATYSKPPPAHFVGEDRPKEDELILSLYPQLTTSTLGFGAASMEESGKPERERPLRTAENFPSLLSTTVSTSSLPSPVASTEMVVCPQQETTPNLLTIPAATVAAERIRVEFPEAKTSNFACWMCVTSMLPDPCTFWAYQAGPPAEPKEVKTFKYKYQLEACCGSVQIQETKLLPPSQSESPIIVPPAKPDAKDTQEPFVDETNVVVSKDCIATDSPNTNHSEKFAIEQQLNSSGTKVHQSSDSSNDQSDAPPMSVLEVEQLSSDGSDANTATNRLLDSAIACRGLFPKEKEESMHSTRLYLISPADPTYMSWVSIDNGNQSIEVYGFSSEDYRGSSGSSGSEQPETKDDDEAYDHYFSGPEVIRSLSQSESYDGFREPAWSMSPILTSFDTVSEAASADEWSLAPKLTPLLEDDGSFLEQYGVCGSNLSNSLATCNEGDLEVPVMSPNKATAQRIGDLPHRSGRRLSSEQKKKIEELGLFCDFGNMMEPSLLRRSGEMLVFKQDYGIRSLRGLKSTNKNFKRERLEAFLLENRAVICAEESASDEELPVKGSISEPLSTDTSGTSSDGSADILTSDESDLKTNEGHSSLDETSREGDESSNKSITSSCSEQTESDNSANIAHGCGAIQPDMRTENQCGPGLSTKKIRRRPAEDESESTMDTYGSSEPDSLSSSESDSSVPNDKFKETEVTAAVKTVNNAESKPPAETEEVQEPQIDPAATPPSSTEEADEIIGSDSSTLFQISMDGDSIEMQFNELVLKSSSTRENNMGYMSLEFDSDEEMRVTEDDGNAPISSRSKRKVPLSYFKPVSRKQSWEFSQFNTLSNDQAVVVVVDGEEELHSEVRQVARKFLRSAPASPRSQLLRQKNAIPPSGAIDSNDNITNQRMLETVDFDAIHSAADSPSGRRNEEYIAGDTRKKTDGRFSWLSDISESTTDLDLSGSSSGSSSWTKDSTESFNPTFYDTYSSSTTVYSPKPQVISVQQDDRIVIKRNRVTFKTPDDSDWEDDGQKKKQQQQKLTNGVVDLQKVETMPNPQPSCSWLNQFAEMNDVFWSSICAEEEAVGAMKHGVKEY